MIDRDHQQLSLVRQCILLDVSRASVYYRPVPTRAEDLELMVLMDRQYLKTPFYGSRKMKAWLLQQGYLVSRKRVRRLMRLMGLEAIYRRPNTSKPAPGHRIFPYLLKGVDNRVDQVWAADITYPHGEGQPLSHPLVAADTPRYSSQVPLDNIFVERLWRSSSTRRCIVWSSTTGRGLTRLWATAPQHCTNGQEERGAAEPSGYETRAGVGAPSHWNDHLTPRYPGQPPALERPVPPHR